MADTEYLDVLTCPYCGYEDPGGYEFFERDEDATASCPRCGKDFYAHIHITHYFSSEKMEEKNG